jgi:steroid 5-alpha reductase family enzyme
LAATFLQMSFETLGALLGSLALLWVVSVIVKDASIVDLAWGLLAGLVSVVDLSATRWDWPRTLIALCATLWGLRLSIYLMSRNLGKGEDRRYRAMRAKTGPKFVFTSLFTVFLAQGGIFWIVSMPLQGGIYYGDDIQTLFLVALGVALFGTGFVFESVGDFQLARFKADPSNAGKVMDRGLWRYTRHPNYFGDSCVWWGIWLIAVGIGAPVATIIGPLLMTLLLIRVSGVALLERNIAGRRPEYRQYIETTSAFIPRPPKSPPSGG